MQDNDNGLNLSRVVEQLSDSEYRELEEAFAGGNWSRLQSLGRALESWNEDGRGDELLAAFRDQVHEVCDRYPEEEGEDAPRNRCRSFLTPA